MDSRVSALLREQHGVMSAEQACVRGETRSSIRTMERRGELIRCASGVYRHAAVPESWEAAVMVHALATSGVVSHRCAAQWHRLDGVECDAVEATVAPGFGRSPATGVVHESNQISLAGVVRRRGVRVMGIGRTLLDLAACAGADVAGEAMDSALRDRRIRRADLAETLAVHAVRGRPGITVFRELLADRFGSERAPLSGWSRRVQRVLVGHGLPRPELEHRIMSGGRLVAQVDLAYPEARIAIELDGRRWHDTSKAFVADRERWRRIDAAGWLLLPMTWSTWADGLDGFIDDVRSAHSIRSASGSARHARTTAGRSA